MQKLNKKTVNAIAHNIIVGDAIASAWDFVTGLGDKSDFDYAFVNSAADDYCDTCWHTTQNVKIEYSLLQIDAEDMYNNAKDKFVSNFVGVNIQEISVEEVYKALDSIDGDTAMRENYYSNLQQHFKNFVKNNAQYELVAHEEFRGCYTLVSKHTAEQKEKLVRDYLNKYDAWQHIELNNDLAWA